MRVEYQEYEWQRGGPPVRMIRKEEGFCYLTQLHGEFAGTGEQARVYIGDDGYWYLHGSALKPLAATAMSVRFISRPFASASFPGKETWPQTLARLESSDNAQVRELAKTSMTVRPTTRWIVSASRASGKRPPKKSPASITCAPRSRHPALSDFGRTKPAIRRCRRHTQRSFRGALNDSIQWKGQKGVWDVSPDGKIRGGGDRPCCLCISFRTISPWNFT